MFFVLLTLLIMPRVQAFGVASAPHPLCQGRKSEASSPRVASAPHLARAPALRARFIDEEGVKKTVAALALASQLLLLPGRGIPPALAEVSPDLITQVEKLEQRQEIENALKEKGKKQKERTKNTKKELLPFVQKKEDFRLVEVKDPQLLDSMLKIQALAPYLDEVEYLIQARNWNYLQGFLGVFSSQEEQFVDLIDGIYPSQGAADVSAREAMQYEAQQIFLSLDGLNQAAKYKRVNGAEKAFIKLSLAYDRFLKAGDMLKEYDPITSTEPLYEGIPDEALQFDASETPKVKDGVLVLKGPDKGRTGRVLGIINSRSEAVIKVIATREVKLIGLPDIAKQVPSTSVKK